MLAIFLSLFAIFLLLVKTEYLWKKHKIHGEIGRKTVHILTGCFVAFWPYYMSFEMIQLISIGFVAVIFISQKLKIFRSIRAIKRRTWGELLFAIGIGLSAFLSKTPAIFTAAILHMALADGLAALVGSNYPKGGYIKIFNDVRHHSGTLAFFITSVLITAAYLYLTPQQTGMVGPLILLFLPIGQVIVESISVHGTDNLTVPLYAVVILNMLTLV